MMERAGRVGALARGLAAASVAPSDAALHLAFVNEYVARALDPRALPHGRVVRILDVAGLSLGDMASGTTREFLSACAAVLSPFYPERVATIFVVNAPPGFTLAFSLVSPLCARRTLERITVLGANEKERTLAALSAVIAPENLPREFGGSCDCGGGEGACWRHHASEEALWAIAEGNTPAEARVPREAAAAAEEEGRAGGDEAARRADGGARKRTGAAAAAS
jgi:hypothetical protein